MGDKCSEESHLALKPELGKYLKRSLTRSKQVTFFNEMFSIADNKLENEHGTFCMTVMWLWHCARCPFPKKEPWG